MQERADNPVRAAILKQARRKDRRHDDHDDVTCGGNGPAPGSQAGNDPADGARGDRLGCTKALPHTSHDRLSAARVVSSAKVNKQAFVERRHGHPTKLRGDFLTWVLEYCQSHASASSSELQRLVAERFSLDVACQSTEPCPCRSRTEPPSATARKKSRKGASRLPQDSTNRLGAC